MQLPIAPASTPTTAQRPTAPRDEPALYGVYGDYDEHQRYHDKHPAPAAAVQDAEGGARIVDVHELEHARYERMEPVLSAMFTVTQYLSAWSAIRTSTAAIA